MFHVRISLICKSLLLLPNLLIGTLRVNYVLANLFNMCLKESFFPDCRNTSSVGLVFKKNWRGSVTKTFRPLIPNYVVRKIFKKLVKNRVNKQL